MSEPVVEPFRMFGCQCPFRKDGTPVLGNMGSTIRPVIVIEAEEWGRLCKAVPQLQTTMFNVGTFDD